MSRLVTVLFLATAFGLSACAQTGTYPLGKDQCKPSDPVQEMHANDCMVPGT